MTAAAAALAILIGAFSRRRRPGASCSWLVETPARQAAARAEARRRRGMEALGRGFLAAAAGDGSEARRLAQQAGELVEDAPALVRILAAQAAEAAGDAAAAQAAYAAMLGFPEMRLAGHRGLMQGAAAQGDHEAALRHAKAAYGLARTSRWAWRALLESRLEGGDWAAALELVSGALERKIVSPISADRARAALLAASAASLEAAGDPGALEFATQSAKLDIGFPPGAVIAARLLIADNSPKRATALIEQAWKTRPHPALFLLWRDLKMAENPEARAIRLGELAALNPSNRESRFVAAEQALLNRDPAAARTFARAPGRTPGGCAALRPDGPHRLRRRKRRRGPRLDGARRHGPAGSRLDRPRPKRPGLRPMRPLGLGAARLRTYAETGELIHPRLLSPPRAHPDRTPRTARGLRTPPRQHTPRHPGPGPPRPRPRRRLGPRLTHPRP